MTHVLSLPRSTGPAALTAVLAAACAAPVSTGAHVTDVTLGNEEPGSGILTPRTLFTPTDVLHLSVTSDGEATDAVVTARWTFEDGQQVDASSIALAADGPTTTCFELAKPGGWPQGRYSVEVVLDGEPVSQTGFEVRR